MSHLRLTTLGRSLHILSTRPAFRLSFLSPLGQQRANYAEFGKTRVSDPMIGDYPNKPWEPRGLRPPTGWWDQQERINSEEEVRNENKTVVGDMLLSIARCVILICTLCSYMKKKRL